MPSPPSRVEEALASPTSFRELFSPNEQGSLAERVEEALLLGRRDLRDFSARLESLVATQVQLLQEKDRGALTSDDVTPLRLAYQIGVLSFSHLLIVQAAERRAPDRIEDWVRSAPLAPYLQTLANGEFTNSELSELLGETAETVSRKLRRLRAAGVADFRRDGRLSTNFLTSLGRTLIPNEPSTSVEPKLVEEEKAVIRRVVVKRLVEGLPEHLRGKPIMSSDSAQAPALKVGYGG